MDQIEPSVVPGLKGTENFTNALIARKKKSAKESEGEQLEELCSMNAGDQKQNSAPTTEE